MAGKKGMKWYPEAIKSEISIKVQNGQSVNSLSKKYGISRYAIQYWCGLRPEAKKRLLLPTKRGRPRKHPAPLQKELENENKRLKMENELLRDFLCEIERE